MLQKSLGLFVSGFFCVYRLVAYRPLFFSDVVYQPIPSSKNDQDTLFLI